MIASCVALGLASCSKDFASIIGIDADATIEMKLYGSNYNFNGEKFMSTAGYFTEYNHPEIVMKEDGGFTLDLYRELGSGKGNQLTFNLYINNDHSTLELKKVYSLVLLGDAQACIDIRERGDSQTLPGGGTVTEIITHCYRAIDGYIKFTKIEEYGSDYLFSGEFSFKGQCANDKDIVEVRNGKFTACRVCVSVDGKCHSKLED